jgi:carbonic anhydrase
MIGRNLITTLRGATLALALGATTLVGQTAGVQTKASQQALTPKQAVQMLKDGNDRFVNGQAVKRDLRAQAAATAAGQYPYAVILSCIDSRTSSELLMDLGLGDAFNVRIAGNVVNEDILGSMEFATAAAGSKVIAVIGHTACGAVKGARDSVKLGNLTGLLSKIQPAVRAESRGRKDATPVDAIAERNVRMTIEDIRAKSPIIRELEQKGSIMLVGGMHDIATGRITFFD